MYMVNAMSRRRRWPLSGKRLLAKPVRWLVVDGMSKVVVTVAMVAVVAVVAEASRPATEK